MRKYVNGTYSDMTKSEVEAITEMWNYEEIQQLKSQLSQTDYKAIKFAEGAISADEFESIKIERQKLRARINELTAAKGAN